MTLICFEYCLHVDRQSSGAAEKACSVACTYENLYRDDETVITKIVLNLHFRSPHIAVIALSRLIELV